MPAARPSPFDALIEEALAPYRSLWPPHVLTAFREEMLATLRAHPAAARLAAEARLEQGGASGEVHLGGAGVEVEKGASVPPPARTRRAGGK